jgi:hypothetical protein
MRTSRICNQFRLNREQFGRWSTYQMSAARSDAQWNDMWKDIIDGGNARWKNDELFDFDTKHLKLMQRHLPSDVDAKSVSILVPMCGDCKFIPTAMSHGFRLVGVEYARSGVEKLIERVGGEFRTATNEAFSTHVRRTNVCTDF